MKILFISLLILSCNENREDTFSINQSKKQIVELQNLVLNKGDSSAYYELFNVYVDKNSQNTDLFYFSYIMAFKYNYPKAYIDLFFSLCKIYKIDTDDSKINLNSMDDETRQLAIECIKRAAKYNYLNSKKIYESLITK